MNKTLTKFKIYFHKGELVIRGFSGRIAHGAFLQLLRQSDQLLSEDLHKGNQTRTFSLRPIYFPKNENTGVLEVTTFDTRIIKTIIQLMLADTNLSIFIVDTKCEILKIDIEKIILEPKLTLKNGDKFRFNFHQPTFFSNSLKKTRRDPYPDLDRLWLDLLKTYEFIIKPISDVDKKLLVQKLKNQLTITYLDIKTKFVNLSKDMKVLGFVGKMEWVIDNQENLEILPTLILLANYWGIGGKRSMGLGNTSTRYKMEDVKFESIKSFEKLGN